MSEELQFHLDLTSRDLNHARAILECREPGLAERIASETGNHETTVRTVLAAACELHTFWPSDSDTPLTDEEVADQRAANAVYDARDLIEP